MRPIAGILMAVALLALSASAWSAASPRTVTCASIVDPGGSVTWRPKRVVLDVVAVPPVFIPQTVATGQGRWPYWSKAGLVVRADSSPVVIAVPVAWRERVAIGWGQGAEGAALRIASCPQSSSLADRNPYAGGFLLKSRSACVPLTFRVAHRSATVRFGIGKRCA